MRWARKTDSESGLRPRQRADVLTMYNGMYGDDRAGSSEGVRLIVHPRMARMPEYVRRRRGLWG